MAAIYVEENGGNNLYYAYTDHLGSLTALTGEDGSVKERQAFDPWGNRRDPDDWTSLITTPVSYITGRGYTMHEHLDDFALINMNGRVYDPRIARFLSPDPQLQAPGYWLNYNRYGYCFNNPLIYSDPSGMRTLFGRFFHWAGTGINNANDWFWDTTNHFGRYLDEMGISVNIEGGYNSAQGAYVESGGYRQYVNQAGVNPADNVNKGIDDARYSEAFSRIDLRDINAAGSEFLSKSSYWLQGVPILGPALSSGQNLDKGNYFEAILDEGYAFLDVFAFGYASKYRAAVSGAAKSSTNIGRVFWSGGDDAMNAAMKYAKANGGTTLEMTRAGQNLTNLTKGMQWREAAPLWNRMSGAYAKGANGTVHVFQNANTGVRLNSVWRTIEYPILKSNNVKIIYHIIP